MAVPWGQVDAEPKPVPAAGLRDLPHHIALTAAPGAARYRVVRVGAGPETEAIMVLRGEDELRHAGVHAGPRPLVRVERRGVEQGRVLGSIAPLTVGERVHPEVDEAGELQALPR